MSFACKIKLSEVNNLSDARFGAAAGFDYLGFCFDTLNPAFIPPVKAKEIIDWVSGPFMVGEFGEQQPEEINQIAELLQLDLIEINNDLLPDEVAKLGKPVIKYLNLKTMNEAQLKAEIQAYSKVCAGYVCKVSPDDIESLAGIRTILLNDTALFITGIDNPDELYKAFITGKPDGIYITGSNEEMVGIKDFETLQHLVEKFTIIE